MAVTFQKYNDSAISKTINLPETATVQDMRNAWVNLWLGGAKGGTVYRDKSRHFQILNTIGESNETDNHKFKRPLLQNSITLQLPYIASHSENNHTGSIDYNPDMCFTTLTFNPVNGHLTGVFQNIREVDPERLSLMIHANIELSRTLKNGRSLDEVIEELEKIRIEGSRKGVVEDAAVASKDTKESFRFQVEGGTTREDLLGALYVARFITDSGANLDGRSIEEKMDLYYKGKVSLRSIINAKGQIKLEERNGENPSILGHEKVITAPEGTPKNLCPECG